MYVLADGMPEPLPACANAGQSNVPNDKNGDILRGARLQEHRNMDFG